MSVYTILSIAGIGGGALILYLNYYSGEHRAEMLKQARLFNAEQTRRLREIECLKGAVTSLQSTVDYVRRSLGEHTGFLPPRFLAGFQPSWDKFLRYRIQYNYEDLRRESFQVREEVVELVRLELEMVRRDEAQSFGMTHFMLNVYADDRHAYTLQYNVSREMFLRMPGTVEAEIRRQMHRLIDSCASEPVVESIKKVI